MKSAGDDLEAAIVAYYGKVVERLSQRELRSGASNLQVIVNPRFELRSLVESLESQEEFRTLVKLTKALFQTDKVDVSGWWDDRVRNFFRRSGLYKKAYGREPMESDELVRSYLRAFERRKIERTYLAPIEYVSFHKENIDLGSFQIQLLSVEQIDLLFQNDINRVFFESAVAEARRLEDYWFLRIAEPVSISDPLDAPLPGPEVTLRYTPFPESLERVLQQLALFYWPSWFLELDDDDDPGKGWFQINVPFVLIIDDDLLSAPRSMPNLSSLDTEPHIIAVGGKDIEIERPASGIDMAISTPTGCLGAWFEEFMTETGCLLEKVRPHFSSWPFLERALQFLSKAFLSDGPEQLLWHLTTLEALFGQSGAGVSERLARRIGAVLGADTTEQESIRKQFKNLYDFRSELVHGKAVTKIMFRRNLREARELARRGLRWFLHFATDILNKFEENDLPSREQMLRAIDLTIEGSSNLNRLISNLPASFPNNGDWTSDWPDDWPDIPRAHDGTVSADLQAIVEQYKTKSYIASVEDKTTTPRRQKPIDSCVPPDASE